MLKFTAYFLLLEIILGFDYRAQSCTELSFLPMPKNISCDINNQDFHIIKNPCRIIYHIKGNKNKNDFHHFKELIDHQQMKTFNCNLGNVLIVQNMSSFMLYGFQYSVQIQVRNPKLKSAFTTSQEAYQVEITDKKTTIKAQNYVGFVRGLETFLQSVQCQKYQHQNCKMKNLPIKINDQPAFSYRGVMVDTARHYLPIHMLHETVDALMYNKMNVLHWHITDQDSFPLILQSHPEIAQYGAFSKEETYTTKQARQLVRYALVRGVRVIPELDTPGHAASWGLAPQNKGVSCTTGIGFMGPLDVTLDKTYKLVRQVFTQIIDIFPDPFIHLGGDQVSLMCLQNKTQFVEKQKISEKQIQRQYRRKQHQIIKKINKEKIPMYWLNSKIEIEEGDIVHWWGGGLPKTQNPVVISNYEKYYIDMGFGNYYGAKYGQYMTWLDLYKLYLGKDIRDYKNKKNVLGAEVTLWSELNNQYTHHTKIWIRTSSTAERTWTTQNFQAKPNFFRRITQHERLMNRRGIPTAPATSVPCEYHPEYC